jgi:hypothetical protein
VPSPKTAKSVEIGFEHATVSSLGPQDQWVLEPVSDKQIKIESLTGELRRGGKLSGKCTPLGALSTAPALCTLSAGWNVLRRRLALILYSHIRIDARPAARYYDIVMVRHASRSTGDSTHRGALR